MKKLLILLLIPSIIFANTYCDFKNIKEDRDFHYYPKECHRVVGEMAETIEIYKKETVLGDQIIQKQKDLAVIQEQRIELWQKQAFELEEKYHQRERDSKFFRWMYFGMGIAMTSLSVHLAGKLGDK